MIEKYSCFILEENQKDASILLEILKDYNFLEIIGNTQNLKEGLTQLNALEPQILFLNFQSNHANKSELLKKVHKQPTILFIIDNDSEIFKNFKLNDLKYIVKPYQQSQITLVLESFMQTHQQLATKMQTLLGKLKFDH